MHDRCWHVRFQLLCMPGSDDIRGSVRGVVSVSWPFYPSNLPPYSQGAQRRKRAHQLGARRRSRLGPASSKASMLATRRAPRYFTIIFPRAFETPCRRMFQCCLPRTQRSWHGHEGHIMENLALYHTLLYYSVLYCTLLYYAALYCTIYCTILYHTVLYGNTLY